LSGEVIDALEINQAGQTGSLAVVIGEQGVEDDAQIDINADDGGDEEAEPTDEEDGADQEPRIFLPLMVR
jgi:hypothetical protein